MFTLTVCCDHQQGELRCIKWPLWPRESSRAVVTQSGFSFINTRLLSLGQLLPGLPATGFSITVMLGNMDTESYFCCWGGCHEMSLYWFIHTGALRDSPHVDLRLNRPEKHRYLCPGGGPQEIISLCNLTAQRI